MSDTPAEARQRAVASGIRVQLGLMSLVVDAVPVRRTGLSKSGFNKCCPTCPEPTRVSQVYTCANQHGPFREDQLGRGRDVDGIFTTVSDEEYEVAMGGDSPKGELTLGVYPAEQVEATTIPDEAAYRLRPGKGTSENLYGWLMAVANDPRYALVGELNVKGSPKPFRLTAWKSMLVVQSLIRPDDLSQFEGVTTEAPDAKVTKLLENLLKGELTDFDSSTFKNLRQERLAALDQAKRSGTTVEAPKPAAEADVFSLLEASLAKARTKTRRPVAKRTRKAS